MSTQVASGYNLNALARPAFTRKVSTSVLMTADCVGREGGTALLVCCDEGLSIATSLRTQQHRQR